MELNLQRQTITINEVIYDASVEQPVECDALLPDYCPDIVKVLKCSVTTSIGSTAMSGERLTIDGMAAAHVYYAPEGGGIRHAEYKIPFSKVVELRAAPQYPVITVTPGVDYINCRAVNQRRLDIRGALGINVKVCERREEQIISDADCEGVQLRRDMVHTTDLFGVSESQFTIDEELECGYGKSPVGNIVRADYRVNVHDHKIVAGKVVAKGDFMLHICYQSAESQNKIEVMEYSLPVSQIIDCDGVDEGCVCDVEMYVLSCDVQPKADDAGEYRIFSLDARVKAVVTGHRHKEVPVASDCYSTKYESKCTHRPVSFIRLVDNLREVIMHKTTLDLPENVSSVIDCWCEVDNVNWKHEQESLKVTLRLTVSMFAQMEDGECLYFEQASDLAQEMPLHCPGDKISFEPTCDILSAAYNLVGREKIDIRCEVLVKGCVYCVMRHNSIDEIAVDEGSPKHKERNKLYIYYAEEGESVWSIAKHYNTSANAIWEENGVENDILASKRMLLIPIV